MTISFVWKPVQWVLDKAWEIIVGLFKPKSATEQLAALQLQDREFAERLPVYIQQVEFAFSDLAHRDPPGRNTMTLAALAREIDETPALTRKIADSMVASGRLKSQRAAFRLGETQYTIVGQSRRSA